MSRSLTRGGGGWVNRFWLALEYNDQRTLRQLLAQGINVNHSFREPGHRRYKQTPIFIAVSKNNRELTLMLIEAGCDLEHSDQWGETVMFTAVRHGKMPMIRLLVAADVNINHQNKKGESVLFLAIKWGRREMVEYLLSIAADADLRNRDEATPLLVALELYENTCSVLHATRHSAPSNMVDIISTITPLTSDINHQHPNRGSALRIALSVETSFFPDNLKLSKLLLQHGAIPDRLFFLRFGGLNATTTKPGSEFFTEEFFDLAYSAGASLQRERTWLYTVLTEMPQELKPYQKLFQDLLQRAMCPPSLKLCCLMYIRKLLDGRLWQKIDQLPLPASLKSYLKLQL